MRLADHEAEALLTAWGAFLRAEVEAEVGYPSVAAGCRDYHAPPEWAPPPPGPVRPGDVERACLVMCLVRVRYKRLHRDMLEHYRDGRRLGWERLRDGRHAFAAAWAALGCCGEKVVDMRPKI